MLAKGVLGSHWLLLLAFPNAGRYITWVMILHGIEYQRPTSLNMRILADHVTYSFLAFMKSIFHFCLGCYCGGYSQNGRSNLSSCDCYWYFYGHYFSFELHDFWLSSSGSANAHPPGYFHRWTFPLNIRLNILPSDSFMSYLDSLLGYSTGLVPGFATDCPCVVWCCELNTCLLYYGSLFGNLVWNDSGFISLT